MPQKQPPANTTVSVFGGAATGRAMAVVAEAAATKPAAMIPRVKPRIMIPSSVPLSRSTPFFPLARIAFSVLRTSWRRHLRRVAGRQHLDHFIGNVPGSNDPEPD